MVASQVNRSARLNRTYFNDALKTYFGRNDVILYNQTRTINSEGDTQTLTDSTSTILGDLQYGPELDKSLIDEGIIQEGNGMFYCAHDITINEFDYIEIDSVKWTFIKLVRKPRFGKDVVHQEWEVARREV